MPDSVIRPQTRSEHDQNQPETTNSRAEEQGTSPNSSEGNNMQDETFDVHIIWTPTFLLIFALTLVLGLSMASLLTQGWSASLLSTSWIMLVQVILVALSWLGLASTTHSRWIRIGGIFGGLVSAFICLNIFLNLQGLDPNAPLQSYLNAATCMALLGTYSSISIKSTHLSSWDTWLFFLIPLLAIVGVALTYDLTPQASILTTENALATAALIASCLLWCLRPSCWKSQPGPTFIFSIVPVILLAMASDNMSLHNFFLLQVTWPHISVQDNLNNFFFAQVAQLCLLLGCMRLIKSEKAKNPWQKRNGLQLSNKKSLDGGP